VVVRVKAGSSHHVGEASRVERAQEPASKYSEVATGEEPVIARGYYRGKESDQREEAGGADHRHER
jgi:hypothetical protein